MDEFEKLVKSLTPQETKEVLDLGRFMIVKQNRKLDKPPRCSWPGYFASLARGCWLLIHARIYKRIHGGVV